jgi:hypothetical protein
MKLQKTVPFVSACIETSLCSPPLQSQHQGNFVIDIVCSYKTSRYQYKSKQFFGKNREVMFMQVNLTLKSL